MKKILVILLMAIPLSSCMEIVKIIGIGIEIRDSNKKSICIFENESDADVRISIPDYLTYEELQKFEGKKKDTTMSTLCQCCNLFAVNKGETQKLECQFGSYENWVIEALGHYSMFIIENNAELDGISTSYDKVLWLLEHDEYLQRYDLTYDDMLRLRDSKGILRIVFPPDDRMKSIKMWPPYGTYDNRIVKTTLEK